MTPRISPDVLDPTTDARLRALDAAPSASASPADRLRATSTLEAILATDPRAPLAPGTLPEPAPRRHPVRWAAAAAAVALVAGGAFVAQTATAPEAFASWTATPAPVTAADAAVFETACRQQVGTIEWFGNGTLSVRLAERRGDYVAMLLTGAGTNQYGPTEASVTCLGRLPVGGASVEDLGAGSGGGAAADGYDPSNAIGAPLGAEFYEGAISQFAMGGSWLGGGGEPASFVDGKLGPDVARLTIHSADGKSVDASIKDGTYAAWWPGAAYDLSQPLPPSGEGGPRPQLTYDVTLKDGTVRTNVTPTRPHN